ncbi:hypothetical protein [Paraburkholderia phytofirmans]|uniref:hypothetical protein n=1 Tax=Paraburkholderia phytofirmans TaxID=261302 RepID=UPI0038BAFDCC
MNADSQFMLSRDALTKLHDEARRMGLPVGAAFRRKAYAAARARKPEFRLSGGNLERIFTAGVHPNVYTGLVDLTKRLGVPVACIGELVCTHISEDAE